jgi:type VI secretion system VgrG family protein
MATEFTARFQSAALDSGALYLLRAEGTERFSHLYEIQIDTEIVTDPQVVENKLDAIMLAPARVLLGEDSSLYGMIRAVELQPMSRRDERPRYRFTLVPRLWTTTQTRRSRVFQQLAVPDIIKKVLTDDAALTASDDFEIKFSGSYPVREYTVQYEETDFAFLSRLMEDEGIFYYFDHSKERDFVVFTDSNDGCRKLDAHSELRYRTSTTAATSEHGVLELRRRKSHVPAAVLMLDYNWSTPSVPLEAKQAVAEGKIGAIVITEENFNDLNNGKRLAKVRAEQIGSRVWQYEGTSRVQSLRAGDRFGLIEHFMASLDGEYLTVEVHHLVIQRVEITGTPTNQGYTNTFVAIPAKVPFHPEQATPKPRVDGLVYATVDGPDTGLAAPIDEQGRYKLVMSFDTASGSVAPGGASRWVRMAQPLSGAGYGVHFPLHQGGEVVVSHIYGNPDRPIIVGAVPNAATVSPVNKSNATQSVIQTMTGIRIEFEDNA